MELQRITAIQPFSSASSSSVNTFRQATNIFASCCCPFVGKFFGRHRHWRRNNRLIYSSLVEYFCCGTVTVAADVTINHVEADDLGHAMMLNDPKYNSSPAVFIGIVFFREHLLVFPDALAFFGIMVRTCMEWTDPAVHHHGILRCRRVVLIQTQGKWNRSALDHRQFPVSMWAIIGRSANYNQRNLPSSSSSPVYSVALS